MFITTSLVQLTQPLGVEMNAYLVLNEKPTRQETKLKTLSKYVQQHPSGWKKRLELADLLYAMGRWQQAVEEYRQVLLRQPRFINLWLHVGKILQSLGREAEAIEVYENAFALTSNVATQYHLTGLIETCRRRTHKASECFSKAALLEAENAFHWLALGLTHLDAEVPFAALQAFDALLQLNPNNIVALSHSYDALVAVGDFQEAIRRLERSLELFPQDLLSLKRLADERSRRGLVWERQGKQTKQIIQMALRYAPDAAYVWDSLAQYHLVRGEWKKGVALLQQFVEQHPLNPGSWYYYARCLFHTGDATAASEAILKAYELYPKDCEIYLAACEILPDAGRGNELQPLVSEMLERFPERWSVWVTAGRVLVENLGQSDPGCTISAKGTQLQPQLADVWFRHGRVLALAGRHQEAVIALLQGWQMLPPQGGYLQSVPAAVWLGESYQALGEDRSSWYWWQEACERAKQLMEFNRAIALYWQGRALEGLGDGVGAAQAYGIALSRQLLYPAHGEVKEALKRL